MELEHAQARAKRLTRWLDKATETNSELIAELTTKNAELNRAGRHLVIASAAGMAVGVLLAFCGFVWWGA